jgi:hypothetical protein
MFRLEVLRPHKEGSEGQSSQILPTRSKYPNSGNRFSRSGDIETSNAEQPKLVESSATTQCSNGGLGSSVEENVSVVIRYPARVIIYIQNLLDTKVLHTKMLPTKMGQ